jgi:beta-lactamase class A
VERRLQRDVDALVRGLPATAGVYVQHLRTGCGAAVNAAAPFPAASTLKTAILLEALRASAGAPRADLDGLLDAMIEYSDDRAANAVLARLGDGPGRVTALLRGMGLGNALVRRPYIIEDSRARPIPVRATSRPALYTNFVASPHDLARLMVAVQRGATGAGPLRRIGLSAPVVRTQALARLLEVRDSTKIVRGVPEGTPVAHKSGFTEQVKHDAGIVYLPRGPIVVSVMTWSAGGVGDAQGDPFIARVAESAVRRLGAGGRC